MKRAILLLTPFLLSCKTTKEIPIETKIEVRDRLVEVSTPADSTWLMAYLKCSQDGEVLMTEMSELKSTHMQTRVTLQNVPDGPVHSAVLTYQVKKPQDVQTVSVRDSFVYKEIPIHIPGPIQEINKLTHWQIIQIYLGRCFLVCLLGLGIKWRMRK